MRKGLIIVMGTVAVAFSAAAPLSAQVYKVVDENGNVTYTDQPPVDGSGEIVVPELPVVQVEPGEDAATTAAATPGPAVAADDAQAEEEAPKTPRQLRQMFRDFRILTPAQDETYWGTGNTVVVSWGANAPYEPEMTVSVVVDGQSQEVSASGNLSVTLDRGEHQVYAELRDQRGRRIVTTPTVTFYVQQGSRLINPG